MFASNCVLSKTTPPPSDSTFVNLSFGRSRYRFSFCSQNATTVVLILGFYSDYSGYDCLFENLEMKKKYNVLPYDIYGRGWSEAMSVLMCDSVVVSQLVKLLLSLKIGKLIFVGWCAGCLLVTSVLFTSRYPDRVVGIVNLAGHNTPHDNSIYSEYTNCILSAAASAVVRAWGGVFGGTGSFGWGGVGWRGGQGVGGGAWGHQKPGRWHVFAAAV